MIRTTITKEYKDIPIAHRQANHSGHCRWIHGHNWSFEFVFSAPIRDACGFIVDFGQLSFLKDVVNAFDHALMLSAHDPELRTFLELEKRDLCELIVLEDVSCEGFAEWLIKYINSNLPDDLANRHVRCDQVRVWEDNKNTAVTTWVG